MPLNNSINKTSDTFFATDNITANFTSPVLTTSAESILYTNSYSTVLQSTNESAFTSESFSNTTNLTAGSFFVFNRSLGTQASPLNVTSTVIPITQFKFSRLVSGTMTQACQIGAYASSSNTAGSRIVLNVGGSRFGLFLSASTTVSSGVPICFDRAAFTGAGTSDTSTPTYAGNSFPISGDTASVHSFISFRNDTDAVNYHYGAFNYTSAAADRPVIINYGRSRGTSPSSQSPILANDAIAVINFLSTTSGGLNRAANIVVNNDNSTSGSPGVMTINTTPIGATAVSETMRLDNAGRVTQIRQPSFSASLSADQANATGDSTAFTVPFNVEQYDQGSNFASNTFTAPIAGKYRFAYTISVDDLLVGHTKMVVEVGGRVVERCNPYALADSDGFYLCSGMVDLSLAASATVTMVVTISGSTKTVTVKGTTTSGTFLSGQLQV